ncbi:hypothetical protein ACFY89_10055 [Achromobacter spanius]|uniref:hypothetical protein n=1 Tax=Achromobacter spanius TaxID=217203 RepID=UPI0036ED7800
MSGHLGPEKPDADKAPVGTDAGASGPVNGAPSVRGRPTLERAAWIATIVGAIGSLYLIFAPSKTATPEPQIEAQEAQASAVVEQSHVSGGQIGNSSQHQGGSGNIQTGPITGPVNIVTGPPSSAISASVPEKVQPVAKIAAFNLNTTHGYFAEGSPRQLPGQTEDSSSGISYSTTDKWADLGNCIDEAPYKGYAPSSCGNISSLAAVFDVTLLLEGEGTVVLNQILARVTYAGVAEGSAAGVTTAEIPLSARYQLKLPAAGTDRRPPLISRVSAIPPLLLESSRPARFEVALTHDCAAECVYVMQLQFVLSSGKELSTEFFQLYWGDY